MELGCHPGVIASTIDSTAFASKDKNHSQVASSLAPRPGPLDFRIAGVWAGGPAGGQRRPSYILFCTSRVSFPNLIEAQGSPIIVWLGLAFVFHVQIFMACGISTPPSRSCDGFLSVEHVL